MTSSTANPQGQSAGPTPSANAQRQPGLLHRYIFWTYERGSFHYDVMVTLILLFLFIAPHFIDFHDRPLPEVPGRSSEVLIRDAGHFGTVRRFEIEVRAEDLHGARTDQQVHDRIADRVRQITPDAEVDRITPVKDPRGQIVAYDATILRGRPTDQE
jgi:hypothetical protein